MQEAAVNSSRDEDSITGWYQVPWNRGHGKGRPRLGQSQLWHPPLLAVELLYVFPTENGRNSLHEKHLVAVRSVQQGRHLYPSVREH